MKTLIDALSQLHKIDLLDLSENKIGDLTSRALFKLLKKSICPLKILKINDTDLDDEGVAVIMSGQSFSR